MEDKKKQLGFTLIELMMIVAISGIMAGISIPLYGALSNASKLTETAELISQEISLTRVKANARLRNFSYGIYFEINPDADDRVVLYEGTSYLTRDEDKDRIFTLDKEISLSSSISDNDLNFSDGRMQPSALGEIVIRHRNDETITIKINDLGIPLTIKGG